MAGSLKMKKHTLLQKKIGIIGAGNMGEALIKRLQIANCKLQVTDKNVKRKNYIRRKYHIPVVGDNIRLIRSSEMIIVAAKPQDIDGVLKDIKAGFIGLGPATPAIISIAAGITTQYIEERIGGRIRVIRVMPNTPALLGEGISAVSLGKYATRKEKKVAVSIFGLLGVVVEVEERLMDVVTALSGSGPAYIAYISEILRKVGEEKGLTQKTASLLVNQMLLGTAKLLAQCEPRALIERVASKGGTTEAALRVFEKKRLKEIVEGAVLAAAKRSKELSGCLS